MNNYILKILNVKEKQKICNNDIQFSGRERHVLKGHNAQSKYKEPNMKICHNGVHCLGQDGNVTSQDNSEMKGKKEEAEMEMR